MDLVVVIHLWAVLRETFKSCDLAGKLHLCAKSVPCALGDVLWAPQHYQCVIDLVYTADACWTRHGDCVSLSPLDEALVRAVKLQGGSNVHYGILDLTQAACISCDSTAQGTMTT
jgi:hypothetical protein